MSHIVEQLVAAADGGADLFHHLFYDARGFQVVLVAGLASLEIDIRILLPHLDAGVFRIEGALAESLHQGGIVEAGHGLIVNHFNLLQLVGGAETVKEEHERNGGFHRGKLGHQAEVHDFLHAVGGEQRPTGVAGAHHVGMVAKNREGLRCEGTGCHVKDRGQHFAGDLVHIRQHQHQAL